MLNSRFNKILGCIQSIYILKTNSCLPSIILCLFIEFSLNDVFIKFANIEFPLFKVRHYLHCTFRLIAIYFFLSLLGLPIVQLYASGGA